MALRVVTELGGGVPGCRGPRAGWIVSPVVYGHLRTAISIALHIRSVRMLSPQSRTRLLSWCSSRQWSPGRSGPSPGADTGGCRPPASPPAHWRRGRWRRAFRRGCAASRPCSGMTERTVSGLVSTPLRARAAWTLRYPQVAAGAVEDPLNQGAELFPASHGS